MDAIYTFIFGIWPNLTELWACANKNIVCIHARVCACVIFFYYHTWPTCKRISWFFSSVWKHCIAKLALQMPFRRSIKSMNYVMFIFLIIISVVWSIYCPKGNYLMWKSCVFLVWIIPCRPYHSTVLKAIHFFCSGIILKSYTCMKYAFFQISY